MNGLQIFKYHDNDIRTIQQNEETWWVLKDVCDVLRIKNTTDVFNRLDKDERGRFNLGRQGKANIVNESGLYNVILRSDKPEAKSFKRWVTHEILPSIRKHGGYISNQENISTDEFLARAVIFANNVIEEKNKQIEAQDRKIQLLEPKATYYDTVLQCENLVPISVIAKDYGMSAIEMNRLLKEKGVQFKQGRTWLLYQKYADKGYTGTKTLTLTEYDSTHVVINTQWTQKGRLFIYNLLKKDNILPLIERESA